MLVGERVFVLNSGLYGSGRTIPTMVRFRGGTVRSGLVRYGSADRLACCAWATAAAPPEGAVVAAGLLARLCGGPPARPPAATAVNAVAVSPSSTGSGRPGQSRPP